MKNLVLYALALAAGASAFAGISHAQNYPARPVRIIIPFPPGEAAEYFQDFIKSEYEKYGKLVRSIGLSHKL